MKQLPSYLSIPVFALFCQNVYVCVWRVCVCVCVCVCYSGARRKLRKSHHSACKAPWEYNHSVFQEVFEKQTHQGPRCVCVCVRKCMCLEVCVEREREGESYLKSRYTGSGQLWTLSLSQLYLHPEYDIQNFYWKVKWLER